MAASGASANVLIFVDKSSQHMSVSVDSAPRYQFVVSTGRAGGSSLNKVIWTQNLYSRPEDLFPSMEVWKERFPKEPPATLVVGVRSPVFGSDCTIHINAIAVVDG